ncbi:MAG: penicillin-binding protein [Candidatus Wildermuthbacteria bacterium]|nr:penicillin-binding protein [Candidatus Wildermuthbacteria bacterium]
MSKSRHYKKIYQKDGQKKRWTFTILQTALLVALMIPVLAFGSFVYFAKDLPRPERLTEVTLAQPTKIYDRTGNVLLYEVYGNEKRQVLPLSDIPLHLQQAVIATEDAEFYTHKGISLKGMGRALLINLGLRKSQFQKPGGSTITQQLARNSFLTSEKTITRKARELVLTLELERRYSKDEILGFYLNQIPFGSTAYGVGTASELYFQKAPKDLSLAESAVLAALIQAPTYYSPSGPNKDVLLTRKDYVLSRMIETGFITAEEADQARAEEIVFQDVSNTIRAPHFVLYVLDSLMKKYGEEFVREQGLRVVTSLDWDLQQKAEQVVKEVAQQNVASGAHNASLVALNPQTGEILAMVGSKDWFASSSSPEGCTSGKNCFFDPKVNVATAQPGRQPGSAFKPFVYAVAFQNGANDKTVVMDELTNFGVWGGKEYIPQNYDGKFRGEVTLRQALAQSLNVPSVKVLVDMAGVERSVQFAKSVGIGTLRDPSFYGPALVLGGGEVRLLDMVSAYGVFAAEGEKSPPVAILSVADARGNTLEKNQNTPIRVFAPEIAHQITDILSDNEARAPVFGEHSLLFIPWASVAVKTGTTQEYRDGWTIGYTKDIVVGVWAGNNDNSPTNREPGVALAAPIWNRIMAYALTL